MDLVTFDSDHDQKPSKTNGRGRKIRHQNRVQPMQERLKRAQGSSKNYVSCSLNPFDHLKCWKKCISDIHQQFIPGATFQLWPRLTLFPEASPSAEAILWETPLRHPPFLGLVLVLVKNLPKKLSHQLVKFPKSRKSHFWMEKIAPKYGWNSWFIWYSISRSVYHGIGWWENFNRKPHQIWW